MKILVSMSALAAAALLAGGASAQVAGGLTGQVGGSANVGLPPVGQVTQGVGTTMRETGRLARDTAREARETVRDTRPEARVGAGANARADARADRDGAAVDAAIQTGAMLHSSDGQMLGSIAEVTRNSVGRATSFVVRSADGTLRTVPAGSVSVDGDVLVSGWTRDQFNRRPR